MKYCIYCGSTQKETEFNGEHIINNSIGGHETFEICKKHNSLFSDDDACGIDQAIAKTFKPLTILSATKIDRSSKQKLEIEMGNQEFDFQVDHSDGSISIKSSIKHVKKIFQNKSTFGDIYIFGKDDQKLEKNVKHKLGENFDKLLKKKMMPIMLGDMSFEFPLEDEKTLRAIAKIAFNFLGSLNPKFASSSIFDEIRNLIIKKECFTEKHVFPDYEIVKEGILDRHLIKLVGSSETGILYANIVLFGCFPYSILLSENYMGKDFFYPYGIDTKTGKNLDQDELFKSFSRIFSPVLLSRDYFFDRGIHASLDDYLADPNQKPKSPVHEIQAHSLELRGRILNYYREDLLKRIYGNYSKPLA